MNCGASPGSRWRACRYGRFKMGARQRWQRFSREEVALQMFQ